jgi:hypothetical protein
VIVVLGRPGLPATWRSDRAPSEPGTPDLAGRAARICLAARAAGADVELVGAVGDDPEGDEVMVRLGRAGIGHAAVLRDPAARTPVGDVGDLRLPRLDAQDIALGLSYVAACNVLVIAEPLPAEARTVAAEAAAYHGAAVVAIVEAGSGGDALPDDATLLEAPHDEALDDGVPDSSEAESPAAGGDLSDAEPTSAARSEAFDRVVAAYAAALDRGDEPSAAFRSASEAAGWESVSA